MLFQIADVFYSFGLSKATGGSESSYHACTCMWKKVRRLIVLKGEDETEMLHLINYG